MGWYDDYPDNWDQIRRYVYQRDDYTCQKCGARGGPQGDTELHAHHLVPKSEGGSHHPKNLATICWRCHNAEHDHHVPKMSEVTKQSRSSRSSRSTGKPGHEPSDMDHATRRLRDIYNNVTVSERTSQQRDRPASSDVSEESIESSSPTTVSGFNTDTIFPLSFIGTIVVATAGFIILFAYILFFELSPTGLDYIFGYMLGLLIAAETPWFDKEGSHITLFGIFVLLCLLLLFA